MPIAKVNGININYRLEGTGEPLVMISGLSMTLSQWRRQVPSFKKQYQVITFDNRGVGRTDKPQGPYSAKMMAEDTIQLMDYLKIERAHILGGSMGTLIAQEIAINYPERVMKLIFSGAWACQDDGANGFTPEMLEAMKLPFRQMGIRMGEALFNKLLNRIIMLPLVNMQLRRTKEPLISGIIAQTGCIKGYSSLDRLPFIKAPALILAGTHDRMIKPTSADTISRKIPNAKLVKINDGSHLLSMEATKVFNKEVLNFLKAS